MWLGYLDPDWEFAKFHGQANKIGKVNIKQPDHVRKSEIMCKCCHQVIQKQPIGLWENTKELEHLGFGIPLFYTFFRSCITLLFLSICCYHIISLYWAISHNSQNICKQTPSNSRLLAQVGEPRCWTFMVLFSRLQKKVQIQEQIARIAEWLVQFFFIIYTRNKIMRRGQYYDEKTTTLNDYSIIIKNLRPQQKIQAKLREFFQTFFAHPIQIQQITLLPPDLDYKQLKKQNKVIKNKLRKYYKKQDFGEEFHALSRQLQQKNQKITLDAFHSHQKYNKDELQTQKAIIVFNTEAIKFQVINNFPKLKKEKRKQLYQIFGTGSEKIGIKQAPEPVQIIWNNINQFKKKRKVRTFISWFASAAILACLTVAIYFILHAKTNLIISSSQQGNQMQLSGAISLVYITIFVILVFNKIVMSFIFHKLTDLQQLQTGFKFQRSFGIKYCLGLFFTTAVMTLIVQGIQSQNLATYLYGLIDQQTLMFFAATTFVPLFWLINPFNIFKMIKRKIFFGKRYLTQQEANHLMQGPSYQVGKRYAQIVQIVWFTYLYATLIPIGAILALTGLMMFYWIDKYNLLYRSVLHYNIGYQLNRTFMTMLQVTLIMAPAGAIIFDSMLRQMEAINVISSSILILISIIYIFLPKQKLINKIFKQEFMLEQKTYRQVKQNFMFDYHTLHPVLSIVNKNKYQQIYKKKGFKMAGQKQINLVSERHLIQNI